VAMRPGRAGEASRPMRLLIVAWTVQNLVLVSSAMLRLDLYVAAFSLTYLRVAALIWMALVAFGLVTILIRILRNKTSFWLVTANAAALCGTLYLSCFVDFPALIARYNLDHCKEVTGQGPDLDWSYFMALGPAIIPVLDKKAPLITETRLRQVLLNNRRLLVQQANAEDQDWRTWTVSSWRLHRYLTNNDAGGQNKPLPGRL
jgi:hypothetical protein